MQRELDVDVKKSTWPGKNKLPSFPASFHSGLTNYNLNISSMLLMIGYLTTPTSSTGVSLSEFWAWVRYLAAVANVPDMRLTNSFADLDAHQKTILSDDFGMGTPMLWLNERLSFDRMIDGRYFMQRFAASSGALQHRTSKRGPNKTPDFVARDKSGVWHIIECKGTQSGSEYSRKQLIDGTTQKKSIIFPRNHTGQRLACGLCIGVEEGVKSRLTIIDPEPDEALEVSADQIGFADDAATRGVMSKVLRLAGFETAAEATASPLGRSPSTTRSRFRRFEDQRQRTVDERSARAREELGGASLRQALFDGRFRGRELRFGLPRPILSDRKPITQVIIRQGVNEDTLQRLSENPTIEDPLFSSKYDWSDEVGDSTIKGDDRTSTMKIGDLFRSELILE